MNIYIKINYEENKIIKILIYEEINKIPWYFKLFLRKKLMSSNNQK